MALEKYGESAAKNHQRQAQKRNATYILLPSKATALSGQLPKEMKAIFRQPQLPACLAIRRRLRLASLLAKLC